MKISIPALLAVCLLVYATAPQISAQAEAPACVEQLKDVNSVNTDASTPTELRDKTRNFLIEHRNRRRLALQSELDALRNYRQTMGSILPPAQVQEITDAIGELEKNLQALTPKAAQSGDSSSATIPGPGSSTTPAGSQSPCNPTQPMDFCLGSPRDKATDQAQELLLAWREPLSKPVKDYFVEVSEDESFKTIMVQDTVLPDPNTPGAEFKLKKIHRLEPGHTYHWRVRANFTDGMNSWAMNGPFSFTTAYDFFSALTDKGFRLQKALSGPDKGELAEFAFLNTIGEKTVFSTTFALSWVPKQGSLNFGRTNLRPGLSIEGALASDESEAEDAWRFRLSGIFTTSFIGCRVKATPCPPNQLTRPTFEGLYYKGSLKLEGDKDFDVRKLSGEFLITPNSFALAMGAARPGLPSKPLQFQWRPFFSIDAGHTFRRGSSEERKDTILRLVPRVRVRVDLQFIRRWLNLNEVAIFADEKFYYLPLENQRKRNNFFTSGIEFKFTPNVGFGLTYKNGRSAPKFERINTLQGILGVRF